MRELKGIGDEDLQSQIQEVVALVHKQLSSSIDAMVIKMTRDTIRMQLDSCKRCIQLELKAEENKLLADELVVFIHEINACSAGRKTP